MKFLIFFIIYVVIGLAIDLIIDAIMAKKVEDYELISFMYTYRKRIKYVFTSDNDIISEWIPIILHYILWPIIVPWSYLCYTKKNIEKIKKVYIPLDCEKIKFGFARVTKYKEIEVKEENMRTIEYYSIFIW